jgi:hypothetical protein
MCSWLRVGKVHEKLLTMAPRVARFIPAYFVHVGRTRVVGQ